MSDSLMPYLVSTSQVRAVFGSNDRDLVRRIVTDRANRIASIDSFLVEEAEDNRDEDDDAQPTPPFTTAQALNDIIAGQLGDGSYAAYLSAWELICDTVGQRLPESWAFRMSWVEPFDELLKELGLSIQLIDLSFKSLPPFPLPPNPETGMAVGYWQTAELHKTHATLSLLTTQPQDAEEQETLDSIRNWLAQAAAMPDPMIVGFCY